MLKLEGLESRLAPAVYYVSPWGDNGADGLSPETAWAGVERVNAQDFEPGDAVLFYGDEYYPGRVTLTAEDSGADGAPVLLGSYGLGVGRAELGGLDATDTDNLTVRDVFFIGAGRASGDHFGATFTSTRLGDSMDNLTLQNVHALSYRTFGVLVGSAVEGALIRNVLVENCVFEDIGHVGFISYAAHNYGGQDVQRLTLRGCLAHSITTLGIAISGTAGGLVEGCTAHTVGQDYPWETPGGPVGIIVYLSDAVTLRFCEAYNVSNGAAIYDGDGMGFDWGATNCVIESCYSHDNEGPGFYAYNGDPERPALNNVFRNNRSVNDGLSSGSLGAYAVAGYLFGTVFEGNVALGTAPPFVVGQVTFSPEVVSVGNSWD